MPSNVDPAPDANIVNDCEGTSIGFVAPVAGEHYDPANLVAQLELSSFYVDAFSIAIYDDAGNAAQPTAGPAIKDLGNGDDLATWSFVDLEPSSRYTWYVWATDCELMETFFTN